MCEAVDRSAIMRHAATLEMIARDAESVDASVPILCGIAANRLYAAQGEAAGELLAFVDRPGATETMLGGVADALSGSDSDPVVTDVLSLVRSAQRELERS